MKVIIGIFSATLFLFACSRGKDSQTYTNETAPTPEQVYKQKIISIAEIEKGQPTRFLSGSTTYNKNLWGTKLKVHGVIKNKATIATYKDAVVKITYYSDSKKVLDSKTFTINDSFPPNSEKNFELKIDNFKHTDSLGCNVMKAGVK